MDGVSLEEAYVLAWAEWSDDAWEATVADGLAPDRFPSGSAEVRGSGQSR